MTTKLGKCDHCKRDDVQVKRGKGGYGQVVWNCTNRFSCNETRFNQWLDANKKREAELAA